MGDRAVANSLEQLLESLIKMVGRANQNMDSLQKRLHQTNQHVNNLQHNIDHLQKRVAQLEWLMKGQLEEKELERTPIRIFTTHPPTHTTSEVTNKFPFQF